MNILPATVSQAESLSALDRSVPFSAHWSTEDWKSELAQPMAKIWYAQVDGQVVGFIALRGVIDRYELLNLAVGGNWQRQGIATALLSHAFSALGSVRVSLEVSKNNLPAQLFYRKEGFENLGVRKQFYTDGSDALIMGIKL